MKHPKHLSESNKMSIIRIAPICNGKIYVTTHPSYEERKAHMDLPIVEKAEHISPKSDKVACKIKAKYHQHIHTEASPRFCVQHRSALPDGNTAYLYVLPLKSEDEISFREGKFVTSEDISEHLEAYSPDLQMECELLGMASELWADFHATEE